MFIHIIQLWIRHIIFIALPLVSFCVRFKCIVFVVSQLLPVLF